jgi:hypothetical protein
LVLSAALLIREGFVGGGQIVFLFLAIIIYKKEGAVYCIVHEITGGRGGGAVQIIF